VAKGAGSGPRFELKIAKKVSNLRGSLQIFEIGSTLPRNLSLEVVVSLSSTTEVTAEAKDSRQKEDYISMAKPHGIG